MPDELIYVYCVTPKLQGEVLEKIKDEAYFLCYEDLLAIVSRVKESEFDEENLKKHLSDIIWVEAKTRQHIKMINEIMKNSTVIPFKFPTIFKSEDNLKKMLKDYYPQLKDNMVRLEGKEEWAVKIYCDFHRLNETIAQISQRIKQLDKEIASSAAGKAFLLKKKRGELITEEVTKQINEDGQCCFERLKDCACEAVINKLLPREVTEKENEMIANVAYLISKKRIGDFLNRFEEIKPKYKERGFEFDCTGPWPPYNFTKI